MSVPAEGDAATERPRPQYGEYASAEEQRARIRQPDATDALVAGQALDDPANPAPAAPSRSAPPATLAEQTRKTGANGRAGSALTRPMTGWRLADRIVTFGLLAYGLVNVIATSLQLFSFEQYANTILGLFGVDQPFTNVAQGQLWGTVAGITMIVGWLLTALLTWRHLRRGRISFWIPVVGAVVVSIAVSIFVTVPILNDPAFAELFTQVASSGS